jgi:hypothetical protein
LMLRSRATMPILISRGRKQSEEKGRSNRGSERGGRREGEGGGGGRGGVQGPGEGGRGWQVSEPRKKAKEQVLTPTKNTGRLRFGGRGGIGVGGGGSNHTHNPHDALRKPPPRKPKTHS